MFFLRHAYSVERQNNYVGHDRQDNDQGEKWVGDDSVGATEAAVFSGVVRLSVFL